MFLKVFEGLEQGFLRILMFFDDFAVFHDFEVFECFGMFFFTFVYVFDGFSNI